MKLRIISGSLRSRFVTIPPNADGFRPTLERTRESVLEILQPRIARSSVVADICAGSGTIGFEMVSRGAQSVHFVEQDMRRSKLIRNHIEKFGIKNMCRVYKTTINSFLKKNKFSYDIIYFDPPYSEEISIFPNILTLLAPDGILIHERNKETPPPVLPPDSRATITRSKTYGNSAVDFYSSLL